MSKRPVPKPIVDRWFAPGDAFEDGRLVEIGDSYTLVPEDQPERLTDVIRRFLDRSSPPAAR